jgi:hypothetical protein
MEIILGRLNKYKRLRLRLIKLVLPFSLMFICCADINPIISTEAEQNSIVISRQDKNSQEHVDIRDDNILIVDGEPFFPLGAYREPNDTLTDFIEVKNAGFNLLHDYRFEGANQPIDIKIAHEYLTSAQKNGFKIFMGINRQWIKKKQFDYITRWIRELMTSPALLTWYLCDEPEYQGIDLQRLKELNRLVKGIDSYHPSSILISSPEKYSQEAKISDILWIDPYPLGKGPLTIVADRVKSARIVAGSNRPVWTVLQAFSPLYKEYLKNRNKALQVNGKPKEPTPEETRFMAFSALAAGSNGLLWYWSPNTVYHIQNDADETVWQGIVSTVQEMNRLMSFLTAKTTADDDISIDDPFMIWTREARGKRVFILINASPVEAKISFDLGRFHVSKAQLFDNGSEIMLQEGKLSATFAPYEVKIYLIESAD